MIIKRVRNRSPLTTFTYIHLTRDAAVHGVVPAVVGPRGDLVQQDRSVPKQEHLDTDDKEDEIGNMSANAA